jgi:hypothetical protein
MLWDLVKEWAGIMNDAFAEPLVRHLLEVVAEGALFDGHVRAERVDAGRLGQLLLRQPGPGPQLPQQPGQSRGAPADDGARRLSFGDGTDVIGQPPGWGRKQIEEWELKKYHQPGDKLANAIRQNVRDVTAKLKSATPILSAAAADGKIKIVGGIYRLASGKVELID